MFVSTLEPFLGISESYYYKIGVSYAGNLYRDTFLQDSMNCHSSSLHTFCVSNDLGDMYHYYVP